VGAKHTPAAAIYGGVSYESQRETPICLNVSMLASCACACCDSQA
jgi:hypothetical protein